MSESALDLWEVIGTSDKEKPLSEYEAGILTEMLTALILSQATSGSVIALDEDGRVTDAVLSVTIYDRRNTIIAHIYEAPGRVVVAVFKDWLSPYIAEDGSFTDAVPGPTEQAVIDEFEQLLEDYRKNGY
jgi:hypothetical protein